jgi:hypothetical protein
VLAWLPGAPGRRPAAAAPGSSPEADKNRTRKRKQTYKEYRTCVTITERKDKKRGCLLAERLSNEEDPSPSLWLEPVLKGTQE